MLTQCDLIGRLPESSVKELIGNLPLTILPKNLVADPAWTPVFLWHDRTHFDPAHQWFRSVLLRSLEEKGQRNGRKAKSRLTSLVNRMLQKAGWKPIDGLFRNRSFLENLQEKASIRRLAD